MVFLAVSLVPEMECTLQEERSLKLQVESKLLQLEKDHSMLDCDQKQALQKLDELQAQKEKLSEEVCVSLSAKKEKLFAGSKFLHLLGPYCKPRSLFLLCESL